MRLEVLGCYGGEAPAFRLPSFLIDGHLLLEAGAVTEALPIHDQVKLEHILVSHAHLDHVVGLAFLVDNIQAAAARTGPVTTASLAPVIHDLQTHCFNGRLWPDFTKLPPESPALLFATLAEGKPAQFGELTVIPVAVHHTVPATGFVISDGSSGFVFSGDTGPTTHLWEVARGTPSVRAVVVETAFPNRLEPLARASGHLTPRLLQREMEKMPSVPVWVYHIKPTFFEETAEEVHRLGDRAQILQQDQVYTF
ncbi:MAG: MBL fold metallo-hydrolase [Candidatus Rokuibacteriota bacterium]